LRGNYAQKIVLTLCPKIGGHFTLSRAHIYNLISENDFPEGRMLSPGVKAWQRSEVDAWLDKRMGVAA